MSLSLSPRPLITLATRSTKTSTPTVLRCAYNNQFSRGLKTTASFSRISTGLARGSRPCQFAVRTPTYPQTIPVRHQSNKSDEKPTLKLWKFEDINSSLPQDPTQPSTSPSHAPILVDVREPAELSSTGIIPGASAMPLASQPDALFLSPEEFETRFGYPKPGVAEEVSSAPVVFYCKAGPRAKAAAQLAVQAGYDPERVGVYEGSWLDWAGKGGKVEVWEGDE